MNKITLEERRKIFLDIALFIDKVCSENNIKYFLSCGTLLGAIRHKGFIPWDDDFDVMMLREDYDKFSQVINDARFKLIDHRNNKGFQFTFARVYDDRTYSKSYNVIREGVNVDLYVIENVPEEETLLRKYINKIKKLNSYCEKCHRLRNLIMKCHLWNSSNDDFYILNYFVSKTSKYQKQYKPSTKCICFSGKKADETVLQCSWFEKSIDVEFEGLTFKAPVGAHEYLTLTYGDYMQLPPEDQRHPYHGGNHYWKDNIEDNDK